MLEGDERVVETVVVQYEESSIMDEVVLGEERQRVSRSYSFLKVCSNQGPISVCVCV